MRPEIASKLDTDRACDMWDHFWAGDMLKRPIVLAQASKDPGRPAAQREDETDTPYYNAVTGNFERELKHIDEILENTLYLGEWIPSFKPDLGPDQFASIVGGNPLQFSESSYRTNWVEPAVESLEDFHPVFDENNPTWKSLVTYTKLLREHGKGRYVVSAIDFHTHADGLSALRGPQNLCIDFMDIPDLAERAIRECGKLFPLMYDKLYEAGEMDRTGTSCWIPLWCEDRYATIQCDFLCLVGPDIGRKYIIPAIEQEASFLDHCIFHLDGAGSLVHLDSLLAVSEIDAIQWVPGAGQKPMHTWTEVLTACQSAGKKLIIYCGSREPLEIMKTVLRDLSPEGLIFSLGADTREEVEAVLAWLENNT